MSTVSDLVFELGMEEMPARMAPQAAADVKALVEKELEAARLVPDSVNTCVTPRRLILVVRSLPLRQEDRLVERRGPAKAQAFDGAGNPTKAALGFARSAGVEVEALQTVDVGGQEYLVARKEEKGEQTSALLPGILTRVLGALRFPKTMRWAYVKQGFVRPVHWLMAVYNGQVIPVEFAGIKSSNESFGHRFMGPRGPFVVESADQYVAELNARFVLPCPHKRAEKIAKEAGEIAAKQGYTLLESTDLLEQVAHLVEWPVVHMGSFDEKFLSIPSEVLITSMKNHLKFFALTNNGKLTNKFVVVSNTAVKDQAVVTRGNERVLKGRLEDALFFFKEDLKHPLESNVEKLRGQTFLQGLGSMLDKTERLQQLAGLIAQEIQPDCEAEAVRGARLCKADLPTLMVGEFPELQGVMGREYARHCGEAEVVALAIDEHYMPRFAGDRLPATKPGTVLALADKLDLMAGCFCLGLVPTATKDPYGLRRAALGVTRILAEGGLRVPLSKLVAFAVGNFGDKAKDPEKTTAAVLEFVAGRMRNSLTANHATEVVDAVLAAGSESPWDIEQKVLAIEALRGNADYEALILPFKRVINIITGRPGGTFSEAALTEPAEVDLWKAFSALEQQITEASGRGDYKRVLGLFLELRPGIDRYFDEILVLVEDQAVRLNRLAMLHKIGAVFLGFADFTKILV